METADPAPSEADMYEEKRTEGLTGEIPEEGVSSEESEGQNQKTDSAPEESSSRASEPEAASEGTGMLETETETIPEESGSLASEPEAASEGTGMPKTETENIPEKSEAPSEENPTPEGEALDRALAEAYLVYQDNVRAAANRIFEITIGARNGRSEKELLEMTLDVLGRCRLGTEGV